LRGCCSKRVPELGAGGVRDNTLRAGRGENGREYYFIDREEFDRRLAADEFLEWVEWPWASTSGRGRSVGDRADHGQGAAGPVGARDRRRPGRTRPDPRQHHDLHHGPEPRGARAASSRARDRKRGRSRSGLRRRSSRASWPASSPTRSSTTVGACDRRARGHRPKRNCRLARLKIKTIVPPNTAVYMAAPAKPARPSRAAPQAVPLAAGTISEP